MPFQLIQRKFNEEKPMENLGFSSSDEFFKKVLSQMQGIPPFAEHVHNKSNLKTLKPEIMQLNIGKRCNLACKHCHMECSPTRHESMSKATMDECLEVFKNQGFKTLDITGGAPEMVKDLPYLLNESVKLAQRVYVRTNLCILLEETYRHYIELYAKLGVVLFASLPFYTQGVTDGVRGIGVYDDSIQVLKLLNKVGYGKDLELNLVYNPSGAFLPESQSGIENTYREKLLKDYGIVFNHLFVICNNPIGRFGMALAKKGQLEPYMRKIFKAYNADTEPNLMCRNTLSVDYKGYLYDCDFNQALGLSIASDKTHISQYKNTPFSERQIVTSYHCYACTAGAGSS